MERLLNVDHGLRTNVADLLGYAVVKKTPLALEDLDRMRTEIQNAVTEVRRAWADFSRGLISCCERLVPDLPEENRKALQQYIDEYDDISKREGAKEVVE